MWPRWITTGMGLWLMAAASVLGYAGTARHVDVVVGALTASTAIIAMSEVMRPLRWVNAVLGVVLVAAPWVVDYPAAAWINSTAVGVTVSAAALVRGPITTEFGGGWSALVGDAPRRRPPA